MSVPTRVFHHGPKPISALEFRDAVEAVCPPRFPAVRHARPRRVGTSVCRRLQLPLGLVLTPLVVLVLASLLLLVKVLTVYFVLALAVSGGVDSMAMAFLFSKLLKTHRGIKIADNPAESAYCLVIDHQLRQGSAREASRVAQELQKMGLKAIVKQLNWKGAVPDRDKESTTMTMADPSQLPNLESVARTLRYQMLGLSCRHLQSSSLFFAHHSDDQYETVLMRLLAGHGYRGLRGIPETNPIPECYELHGVYKSGLLDDQRQRNPFLSFKPPNRELRRLRWILTHDFKEESWHQIRTCLGVDGLSMPFPGHDVPDADPRLPYLTPLSSEDGGVTIYRPLLAFDKDRLIATCEANKIPWFEDRTNADATLTTRNAVRHVAKSCTLPRALQKPAILALCRRARRKATREETEAHRWLMREAVIQDFDPNAGTLLVNLPSLPTRLPKVRRLYDSARDEARRPHRRAMAAIAIRKLIDFVTPELHPPPLSNLSTVVDRLFPELSTSTGSDQENAKAFSIAAVLFTPVGGPLPTKWFLARAPYSSSQPLPQRKLPGYLSYTPVAWGDASAVPSARHGHAHWRTWKTAKIWDGRFWIRVSACVPARFHVQPLLPRDVKPFRRALPPTQRAKLERILKHHAPGKVRYSLPALYSVEGPKGADAATQTQTLLALPSLGIHVPGLERWVRYEARYKNVDLSLLGLRRRRGHKRPVIGYRASCSASRRRRRRRRSVARKVKAKPRPGKPDAACSG
ncbi:hypothetical protein RJ55_02443 [Drechmeria coniospora]|nr:hypothetical protein RJ55_02443 [Drechmeria coniospora]